MLAGSEEKTGVRIVDTESDVYLAALARDVVNTRVDLVHFPIIYYFASDDRRASVAHCLRHLVRFADEGLDPARVPRVRVAAGALDRALNDLAEILSAKFLKAGPENRAAVFKEYEMDQRLS